jgi:hypothetical protein
MIPVCVRSMEDSQVFFTSQSFGGLFYHELRAMHSSGVILPAAASAFRGGIQLPLSNSDLLPRAGYGWLWTGRPVQSETGYPAGSCAAPRSVPRPEMYSLPTPLLDV